MKTEPGPTEADASTGEVLEAVLHDARDLLRAELLLAKEEFHREVLAARRSLAAFVLVVVLFSTGLAVLVVALAMWLAPGVVPLATIGASALVAALIAARVGIKSLPTRLLHETGRRLENDVASLKEHLT